MLLLGINFETIYERFTIPLLSWNITVAYRGPSFRRGDKVGEVGLEEWEKRGRAVVDFVDGFLEDFHTFILRYVFKFNYVPN